MASLSLSSLCLSQNPNSLRFSPKASPCFSQNPDSPRFSSKASPCRRVLYPNANEFPRVRVPICRVSSKNVFPNLQADDFRHPLDLKNTRRFRAQREGESDETVRAFFAADEFIENDIDTSILAGPSQYANLYELMAETAEILNVATPLLYIKCSPVACARSVAVSNTSYIVVHTSLLEILTLQELQVVFAHELAHLKCDH